MELKPRAACDATVTSCGAEAENCSRCGRRLRYKLPTAFILLMPHSATRTPMSVLGGILIEDGREKNGSSRFTRAVIAKRVKLGERLLCEQRVTGSTPVTSTIFIGKVAGWLSSLVEILPMCYLPGLS
jgi:hypothetical protein